MTLCLTAGQLYFDYRREVSDIEARLTEIRHSHVASLGSSLWSMDRNQLRSQLQGVVSLPDIQRATVRETVSGVSNPLVITVGTSSVPSHIVGEFFLHQDGREEGKQIGLLRVEATLNNVYRRLIDRGLIILASQGLKTFLVSFFILYVVYRLVTRHLVDISRFLSTINLRTPMRPLVLQRRHVGQPDEIDHMVMAFNSMQASLETAYGQVRQANAELELRVQERTRSLQDQIIEREAIERELRESEHRFRDIAEAASDWFWEIDRGLSFVFVSHRFFDATGLTEEAIVGKRFDELAAAGVLEITDKNGQFPGQLMEDRVPLNELEGRLLCGNGQWLHVQIDGKPLFDENGVFYGYRGAGRDVSVRKRAEEAIRRSNEELESLVASRTVELRKLSQAVEQSAVTVIVCDTSGGIEYANQAFFNTYGYSPGEVVGRKISLLRSDLTPDSVYRELWQTLLQGREWTGELLNRRKDGTTLWMQVNIAPVRNDSGEITNYLAIEEDVSLRKDQEQRILHQAQYDSLTDLPNRLLAVDRLNQAIRMARRDNSRTALLFIDLDDFKKVNDTLGHELGDQLLIRSARRLEALVREGDTVARQGGDEFLVVLDRLNDAQDAEQVARKVLREFLKPISIDGVELVVTPSIGLSIFPDDGEQATTLLRNADAAMYRVKEEGGNGFSYFTTSMNHALLKRMEIESHLRHALDSAELQVVYQPIVDTASRDIVGVEALLRWHSEALGEIEPDQFIPIAEQTGIIVPIGKWVMETACRQVAEWNRRLGLCLSLAVNVSPRQFRNRGVMKAVEAGLAMGIQPELLEIEVTEGLLLRNLAETQDLLQEIKAMGLHLSMDDFGTGYSSLSYLKTLPFDRLKVDRSFVRDIAVDPDDRSLVSAAIRMAKSLGLSVVGEGVEEEAQLRILREEGCDFVQGYLFSRPLAAEAFETLLRERAS